MQAITTRRNSSDLITAACKPFNRKIRTPPPPPLPIAGSALAASVLPVDGIVVPSAFQSITVLSI